MKIPIGVRVSASSVFLAVRICIVDMFSRDKIKKRLTENSKPLVNISCTHSKTVQGIISLATSFCCMLLLSFWYLFDANVN
jgi:hypothetical protein